MSISRVSDWKGPGTLVALVFVLAMPAIGSAQTRSSLGGTIRDSSGAVLPGVTMTLASPNLVGGSQTGVTDAVGTYRFTELMAGVYEITAELAGFRAIKRTGLVLGSSGTLTVDLSLEVAAVRDLVTVTGSAPTVDVTTAASVPVLGKELLQSIPVSTDRRLVSNLIELVPGGYGRSSFGGANDANLLMADGVPVGHPARGGIVGSYGISYNWLEEVEYVAVGAAAEFGEFSGNATNFRLRSGSNLFSGLVEQVIAIPRWTGDNRHTELERRRFTPLLIDGSWEFTGQVGGPLKKDRVFFFAGANWVSKKVASRNPERTIDNERWRRLLLKGNWAVSSNVKLEAFVAPDRLRETGGSQQLPLGALARPETALDYLRPATVYNARLTWTPSPNTLVEIRQSGMNFSEIGDPTPPNTRSAPSPRSDQLTGISSVTRSTYWTDDSSRYMTTATLTRHLDNVLGGDHDLKLGLEFERMRSRREDGFPGGMSFQDFGGVPNQVTLWAGDIAEGRTRRTTFFAQDKWNATRKVTLEPGVRININRGSVRSGGTLFSTNAVSPRMGLAWDVAEDHKTVVRTHFGLLGDGVFTGSVDFMDTTLQTPRITARVLGPNEFQELTRFTPATNQGIGTDLKHPYVRQFQIGIQREFFADFSIEGQFIHRDFRNILAMIDTNSRYEQVQRPDPGPDGQLGTADDAGLIDVYNLLNPGQAFYLMINPGDDIAYRNYKGVQITGKKRYSRNWQMLAAYTYSKSDGTANTGQADNAGFGGSTGRGGVFANPNAAINSAGTPLRIFTHQLKLEGSYRVPVWGGAQVSAVYLYISGAPWGRTAIIRGLAQGNETIRIEPRGTRETPPLKQLDLRVEKTFSHGRRTAGVYLDIFNATDRGNSILRFGSGVTEASGANFGLPGNWIDPRTFQVGLRLNF